MTAVQDAVNATVVAVVLPIRNPGKIVSRVSRVSHVDITAVGKFRRLYTKIITNTHAHTHAHFNPFSLFRRRHHRHHRNHQSLFLHKHKHTQ